MKSQKLLLTVLFMAGACALFAGNPLLTLNSLPHQAVQVENETVSTGIFNVTSLDLGIGLSGTDRPFAKRFYGVSNVTGYRFSEKFQAGAGVGVWLYNDGTLLPVFLNGRLYLGKKEVKPFISADAGTFVRIDGNEPSPNLFAQPSAGVRIPLSGKMSLQTSLGVMSQFYEGSGRDSFVTIKVGLGLH